MKPTLRMGMAAIALMASTGMAAAANTTTMSNSTMSNSVPKASASQASDSIKLSSAQEKTIWQDVNKQQYNAKAPSGFTAKVGEKLPNTVMLHPLPTSVTNNIATMRPYEYAMLDQRVLIVNPQDKKVVDVITKANG